jgi:hypothetical protein
MKYFILSLCFAFLTLACNKATTDENQATADTTKTLMTKK